MGGFLEGGEDHFPQNSHFQQANLNSPTSASGGKRQLNESSTRPVSIKQILNAPLGPQDVQVWIDGAATSEITFVACISAIKTTETFRAFSLEDGTGAIDGKLWNNSSNSSLSNPFEGGISESSSLSDYSGFREGIWVRIFGTLKPFNGTKGLSITHMRQIVEFNEITFHNLAVMEAHLVLTRGPDPASSKTESTAFYDSYGSPAINEFVSQTIAQFSPIQRDVYLYYKQNSNTPNGVHINDVIKVFRGRYGHAEVIGVNQFLIEEGYIYITCDDNHAKCS